MTRFLLLVAVLAAAGARATQHTVSVHCTAAAACQPTAPGQPFTARAVLQAAADPAASDGWARLEVDTAAGAAAGVAAWAAGYVEGVVLANNTRLAQQHMANLAMWLNGLPPALAARLDTFLGAMMAWMQAQAAAAGPSDPYWNQVPGCRTNKKDGGDEKKIDESRR